MALLAIAVLAFLAAVNLGAAAASLFALGYGATTPFQVEFRSPGSYAIVGGVSGVIPVDLHIIGCPPRPVQLLKGLLLLLESEHDKDATSD